MAERGPAALGAPLGAGGSILLLALFFLLLLGLVAATVLQSGNLQLHMARNEQAQLRALQDARSLARALAAEPANFHADSRPGDTFCPAAAADAACVHPPLAGPAFQPLAGAARTRYRVLREAPVYLRHIVLREWQNQASDDGDAAFALFEVQVVIDGASVGEGSAEVARGVLLRLPGTVL